MTHITEERVIGNHAAMGGSTTVATRTSLTVTDILAAGGRRGTTRQEMTAAQSTGDSERGVTRECELLPRGTEGLPLAPPGGFGR
jgi:hypothetical protein